MVHTDYAALRLLIEVNELSAQLMRWRLRLGKFDFDLKYEKGHLNTQAYALSRLRILGETVIPIGEEISCLLLEGQQCS